MKYMDVRQVKKILNDYREEEDDIENQRERLDRIETRLYTIGTPAMTALPKSSGQSNDRLIEIISKRDELTGKIKNLVRLHGEHRQFIESLLAQVNSTNQRAVIQMRYLDNATWGDVTTMLFGGREDYLDKEGTYQRRVYKIHGSALCSMQAVINGKQGTERCESVEE